MRGAVRADPRKTKQEHAQRGGTNQTQPVPGMFTLVATRILLLTNA